MWAALKYLDQAVAFDLQVPALTPWGNFRLDACLSRVGQCGLGLELDGAAYHNPTRDLLRDTAIFAEGNLHAIVRIEARYVLRYREQTLWLLSQAVPWLMSKRGKQVLEGQMHERVVRISSSIRTSDSLDLTFADAYEDDQSEDDDQYGGPWDAFVRLDIRHSKSESVLEAAAIMDANRHLTIAQIARLWDAERQADDQARLTTCYYCKGRIEIPEGGDRSATWYHVGCGPEPDR